MSSKESVAKFDLHTLTNRKMVFGLMVFIAMTLVIASALHLTGSVGGWSKPFDPTQAGTAEAIIAVVLFLGAGALLWVPRKGNTLAIVALGFAIVGFLVGLNFTIRGGDLADRLYHATTLPLLLLTLGLLLLNGRRKRSNRSPSDPLPPTSGFGSPLKEGA